MATIPYKVIVTPLVNNLFQYPLNFQSLFGQTGIKKKYDYCKIQSSGTKSISTTSESPYTSMYFHVYKKIYYATAGQHIRILLVSFES